MRKFATLLILIFASAPSFAQTKSNQLQIYFIDVEGGQSTLFVTPAGSSLCSSTRDGPGNNGRDADRIVAAAKIAGLTKIDYVLITHYHVDHAGGVPQLLRTHPGRRPSSITDRTARRHPQSLEGLRQSIRQISGHRPSTTRTAKPGDKLPIKGIRCTVVSADGNLIDKPLPGAGGPNPYCATSEIRPADQTENARSLGIDDHLRQATHPRPRRPHLGQGDAAHVPQQQARARRHPGGLPPRLEPELAAPHWSTPIHPRVAIMDNGAKKGGSTPVLTLRKSPASRPVAAALLRRRWPGEQHR